MVDSNPVVHNSITIGVIVLL